MGPSRAAAAGAASSRALGLGRPSVPPIFPRPCLLLLLLAAPDLAARYLTTGTRGSAVNAYLDVDGLFKKGAPLKLHPLPP